MKIRVNSQSLSNLSIQKSLVRLHSNLTKTSGRGRFLRARILLLLLQLTVLSMEVTLSFRQVIQAIIRADHSIVHMDSNLSREKLLRTSLSTNKEFKVSSLKRKMTKVEI